MTLQKRHLKTKPKVEWVRAGIASQFLKAAEEENHEIRQKKEKSISSVFLYFEHFAVEFALFSKN